ncbi:MAG: hypothetical protein QM756_19910 [Polyangiaceae bacterium]
MKLSRALPIGWLLCVAATCAFACGSEQSASGDLCGNGNLDPGESCDDGNRYDGDNCPSNCQGSSTSFVVGTNRCPVIESVSVLPSEAVVGGYVALAAEAKDLDGDAVYYDWTATGGLIEKEANPKRSSYRCGYVGSQTITLWVFDSRSCIATQKLTVACK